jgi:hypothetical protein
MRNLALIFVGLLPPFGSAVAQTASVLTDVMPLFRDAPRVALKDVRIIDGTGAPARSQLTSVAMSYRALVGGGLPTWRYLLSCPICRPFSGCAAFSST